MNIDQTDREAVALVQEIFPTAIVQPYTVAQQLGHRWARLLHRFGIHDEVWTYKVGVDSATGFKERPVVIGKPIPGMVIVKMLECSICGRRTGPIHVVEPAKESP